jgi:hypothetical protein
MIQPSALAKFCITVFGLFITLSLHAQQPSIADPRTGCRVRMISVGDQPPRVSWDGACQNGFASGYGTVVFDSGIRYTGEMRDGWRNGRGKIVFGDNSAYEGEFANSRFNGQGVYTLADGSQIAGTFRDGDQVGVCTVTTTNKSRMRGNCTEGQVDGQGTVEYPDGMRYVGGLVANSLHGQGVLYTAKGDVLREGEFKSGGFWSGKIYTADGSYQAYENGKSSGAVVPSASKQAQVFLGALTTLAQTEVDRRAGRSGGGSGNSSGGESGSNTAANCRSKGDCEFEMPSIGTRCLKFTWGKTSMYRTHFRLQNTCSHDLRYNYSVKQPNIQDGTYSLAGFGLNMYIKSGGYADGEVHQDQPRNVKIHIHYECYGHKKIAEMTGLNVVASNSLKGVTGSPPESVCGYRTDYDPVGTSK